MTVYSGKVTSVEEYPDGSAVAVAAPAGAMTVEIFDVLDFEDLPGSVIINGTVYGYGAASTATNTLSLSTPLVENVDEGELVLVHPPAVENVAHVLVDWGEDAIRAVVPHTLVDKFAVGIREEDAQESVLVEEERGRWVVRNIVGLDPVVDGSYLEEETVPGTALTVDALDGKTITGALIRSAADGARWEMTTGDDSNNLYGYTDDLDSAPGRIEIDSEEGRISLVSPDYSVEGDGSGAASLMVGGSKGFFSVVEAAADGITMYAKDSVYLNAGSLNASSLDIRYDAAVPANCRVIADTAGHAETLGRTARITQKTAGGAEQASVDLYDGDIDLNGEVWFFGTARFTDAVEFDEAVVGLESTELRVKEFRWSVNTAVGVSSSTPAAMGTRGGEGTFVAPPSGTVKIEFGGQTKSSTDGQYCGIGIELRTGVTVGSGTVVRAFDVNESFLNYNVQYGVGMVSIVVGGLTPGSTYNVRNVTASGTTTGGTGANTNTALRGRIVVTPSL